MIPALRISDFSSSKAAELAAAIAASAKAVVGDVSLRALSGSPPYGVYIFFDQEENPLYVGRVASQSFTVRLAAHFDPRDKSWLNQFVKYCAEHGKYSYESALAFGLSQRLVFVVCDAWSDARERMQYINALERVLRRLLQPRFNALPCNQLSNNAIVDDIIRSAG